MLWRSEASHRPRITERRFCIHSGDTRGSFTLDLKEAEGASNRTRRARKPAEELKVRGSRPEGSSP